MSRYLTTPVVDAISAANIYVDPSVWGKIIIHPGNKKPNWLAIHLFSRILYWYTRSEVRDETTGKFLGFKKKFKYHMLQLSYKSIMEQMGCSYQEARDALASLLAAGLVHNPKDTLHGRGNSMFIEPIVDNILCIIHPKGVHNDTPLCLETQTPLCLETQTSVPGDTESTLTTTLCSKHYIQPLANIKGGSSVDNSGQLPTSSTPSKQLENIKKVKQLIGQMTNSMRVGNG